ncbi:MAG: alpha-ketoglutarate-dependent dioxygenase AlkB [Caulobacteraceae bacterium]
MIPSGFEMHRGRVGPIAQQALVEAVMEAAARAPFYRPITPWGKPMSVEMTNLGPLGWITDSFGYRYAPFRPGSKTSWPPIPAGLLSLWAELADPRVPPDACLVNLYRPGARMSLHQDRDEADFAFPVVSVSLGDGAIFRIGGRRRSDPTRTVRLASGDVVVLAGAARLAFHGVDRIVAGSSRLVPGGGRINLTLRRAEPAIDREVKNKGGASRRRPDPSSDQTVKPPSRPRSGRSQRPSPCWS